MADDKKRKHGPNARMSHGSKHKGRDMGRNEWSRQRGNGDRREENQERNAKRQKTEEDGKPSVLPQGFSQEEIASEERKPKHKVAVMIGYSGTGYRGMQINTTERTIEGDLFTAFVAAGAISKANANDPKKSALVRCARTDKGVHAAGNVISLKLIVEDKDIIEKINANLSTQIRVWGIERTVNSFSCYQACDSRWYEYLIPTHSFLPPHPSSFLGKKLVELAKEAGDEEGYNKRQEEVAEFWAETEEKYVKPIIDTLDESIKDLVIKALYEPDNDTDEGPDNTAKSSETLEEEPAEHEKPVESEKSAENEKPAEIADPIVKEVQTATTSTEEPKVDARALVMDDEKVNTESTLPGPTKTPEEWAAAAERKKNLDAAIKQIRNAYTTAKRAYRIPEARKQRVAEALKPFLGTRNFHNYTVNKGFRDPSAKRHIKSFTLNPSPIVINGTEWLSIKVHGQSFMMHQIRKMISMIASVVRCGCPISRISESFGETTVSIPKVPGLGLLLERPVFESYNDNAAAKFERAKLDFTKYEKEMEEFKQREIYERIFREEAEGNAFHTFFVHVDSFKESQFLYLTSKGLDAVKGLSTTRGEGRKGKPDVPSATNVDSEDDGSDAGEG